MDFLNVIIVNENYSENDVDLLFGKNCINCKGCIYCREERIEKFVNVDMYDLLLKLGSFSSRNQAKKNWKGPNEIPKGWSEFTVGKLKRKLYIWNPSE